jgi:hypothetical protein
MTWLLSLLSSPILGKIEDAYEVWKNAETQEAKLEAEQHLAWLTAQKEVIISEQRSKLTSWIRPALAFPVVLYVWKLIIWDTILELGVTQNPGEFVNWIVVTVIGAYMLTRPFERR